METKTMKATRLPEQTLLVLLLLFGAIAALGQKEPKYVCSQPKEVRESLINEAERNEFNVQRIEFENNDRISARMLFRKIGPEIGEGDIFARKYLLSGLKVVSKIKGLYSVNLDDVEIKLDRQRKIIDISICLKEK